MWSRIFAKHDRSVDPVVAEIQQTEDELLRRLDYVDAQLRRVARKRNQWDVAMTVVDADVAPLEPHERVVVWFRSLATWQWYVLLGVAALAFLCIIVAIAMCGGPGDLR